MTSPRARAVTRMNPAEMHALGVSVPLSRLPRSIQARSQCAWVGSLGSRVSIAPVREHVVWGRWLAQPFQCFRIRSCPIPPLEDVARDDLNHRRVMVAEPVVDEVAHLQADGVQQFSRDRHLPNLGDLMRAVRHGHVHYFINFNNLWLWAADSYTHRTYRQVDRAGVIAAVVSDPAASSSRSR